MTISPTPDLLNRFTYHAPTPEQVHIYENIRNSAYSLAVYMDDHCPDSREKAIALGKLEEMVMWANAAIARNS